MVCVRLVTLLCPTLCDLMDCSLPGPCVHGITRARVLEWVAISFCRGSSPPRDRTQGYPALPAGSSPLSHQKSPELALALLHQGTCTFSFSLALTLPCENTAIHRSGRKLSQKLTMLHLDPGFPVSITERRSVSVI